MNQRVIGLWGPGGSGLPLLFQPDALLTFPGNAECEQEQRNVAKGKRAEGVAQPRAKIVDQGAGKQ